MAYLKTKPNLVIDFDALLFKSTCGAETRYIIAKNKHTGEEFKFNNVTEFWGRKKTTIEGFLKQYNIEKSKNYIKKDFEIETFQVAEDFKDAKNRLHSSINSIKKDLGINKWYGYVGGKDNFRETEDTLIPYKSNRDTLLKPLYYEEMKDYLESLGVERIHGKEVDDQIATDNYQALIKYKETGNISDKLIAAVYDKDYLGCGGYWYYPGKSFEPFLIDGMGKLYLESVKKGSKEIEVVTGYGYAFKYLQFATGDDTDGFKSNYYTDKRFGAKSAYKYLKDCKKHKEYWIKLVEIYKMLYPEPKIITAPSGHQKEVNWLNMLEENVLFAHLQRWEGDRINVKEVLTKLGIGYE